MPKDLIVTKNDTTGEFELTPITVDNDVEAARGAEDSGNLMCSSQLGERVISASATAVQWTAWWTMALVANVGFCALPGLIMGALGGYGYARWHEPCVEEKNTAAVDKCAWKSPDIVTGISYGAPATALIGAAVTASGFLKNQPSKVQKLL